MALRSLRSRLLLGAVLWTAGLFITGLVISTAVMVRHHYFPYLLHGTALTHGHLMTVIAVIFMILGLGQVRIGLSPVNQLRSRLAAVREGRDRRVEGVYPVEVQPLVDDLNVLLAHREQTVARALAKAGDLAHGLKTPLAVLAHEADRAQASGHPELADAIQQQVARMLRQVEYHLAHARAAASGANPGSRCIVIESVDGLVRTLQRLHADRGLAIDVSVDAGQSVRAEREDLDEMLGNLLDNACKWARSRITVSSSQSDSRIVIDIEDDGPGLAPSMREAVLQRGVRADEAAPGSGLGLAIVRDLAELYGGSIELTASTLGGLRARLELPS
jgi:signal transduction histidine kinase